MPVFAYSIAADQHRPSEGDGFDRIRATGNLDDAFMAAVDAHRISLDWLFLGKGAAPRAACDD